MYGHPLIPGDLQAAEDVKQQVQVVVPATTHPCVKMVGMQSKCSAKYVLFNSAAVLPVEPQLLSLVALKDGVHLLPALCSEVRRPLAPHLCGAVDQISHVLFIMAIG